MTRRNKILILLILELLSLTGIVYYLFLNKEHQVFAAFSLIGFLVLIIATLTFLNKPFGVVPGSQEVFVETSNVIKKIVGFFVIVLLPAPFWLFTLLDMRFNGPTIFKTLSVIAIPIISCYLAAIFIKDRMTDPKWLLVLFSCLLGLIYLAKFF
jgi:hypothetical protein